MNKPHSEAGGGFLPAMIFAFGFGLVTSAIATGLLRKLEDWLECKGRDEVEVVCPPPECVEDECW